MRPVPAPPPPPGPDVDPFYTELEPPVEFSGFRAERIQSYTPPVVPFSILAPRTTGFNQEVESLIQWPEQWFITVPCRNDDNSYLPVLGTAVANRIADVVVITLYLDEPWDYNGCVDADEGMPFPMNEIVMCKHRRITPPLPAPYRPPRRIQQGDLVLEPDGEWSLLPSTGGGVYTLFFVDKRQ